MGDLIDASNRFGKGPNSHDNPAAPKPKPDQLEVKPLGDSPKSGEDTARTVARGAFTAAVAEVDLNESSTEVEDE
ncbi:MAG: hypothetical protein AAF413_02050 [Patescibacteria group bacterium]